MIQPARIRAFTRLALALVAAVAFAAVSPAIAAERLPWPSQSHLPPAKPDWIGKTQWKDQAPPTPHMIAPKAHSGERYDPVYEPRAALSYSACKTGEICVKCVANCDAKPAVVVQKLAERQAKASRDPNGDAEAALERGHWNAINCYSSGGCSASNVVAPRRVQRSYDVTITYIRRAID